MLHTLNTLTKAALSGAIILALTACSLEKHLARKQNELSEKLAKEPQWEQLPRYVISWQQAYDIALKDNLDIKRGEVSIMAAKSQLTDVFTGLIPGVNLDVRLDKEVAGLDNVKSDDWSYNTNILFNIPSLTRLPFDYYSAAASVYRAKKSMELKHREIAAKLYKITKDYEYAKESYEMAVKQISVEQKEEERAKINKEWIAKQKAISTEFARVLGRPDGQWMVDANTLPRVNWAAYKVASKKLDHLVLSMMAMEMEAARLQKLGIIMKFFPELNVNFFSPSLFSSTGGNTSGFFAGGGGNDIRMNMDITTRLDTRLQNWSQYKQASAQYKILLEDIRLRMLERREKIQSLLQSREDFESWKSYMNKRMDFLASRTPESPQDFETMRGDLRDMRQKIQTEDQKNAEVEASLILEYGLL